MATPHVAGAVAALFSNNPGASASSIESMLLSQATPGLLTGLTAGESDWDWRCGRGGAGGRAGGRGVKGGRGGGVSDVTVEKVDSDLVLQRVRTSCSTSGPRRRRRLSPRERRPVRATRARPPRKLRRARPRSRLRRAHHLAPRTPHRKAVYPTAPEITPIPLRVSGRSLASTSRSRSASSRSKPGGTLCTCMTARRWSARSAARATPASSIYGDSTRTRHWVPLPQSRRRGA